MIDFQNTLKMMRTKFNNLVAGLMAILIITTINHLAAQNTYSIDISQVKTEVKRGHLDLGGKNLLGDSIGVNSFYIERNGKPIIPVIGEFHYCRYPNAYWDEELKKMKAGGISVVATYVFWNLHEFKEGEFYWENYLNLRHFVELCKNNQLDVIVRIGPFTHGEMRNGGLPDWLYGRPIEVRSNDPAYLFYTQRLYQQIGKQLTGLMFNDGGPVIGIQLENEYQHSAAPWAFTYTDAPKERTVARRDNKITLDGVGVNIQGNEFADLGRDHIKNLKELAKRAGLIVPIYTATGWGYATIVENGSVPVMAGYAFPFWVDKATPSPFYLFKNIHSTPDYSPVSYKTEDYPSLAAELGTGMCVTYSRRPRVPGESFLPLMVRTIGSGSNGLGYYMYHGGTTPSVGNFFLSEGAGLNLKSYDYQAPIREFGNPGTGFFGLKIINSFLKNYGDVLAPMVPVIPETNATITPSDTSTLRYSVRSDGKKGFIFMHNYQDHLKTAVLKDLKVEVKTANGTVVIPEKGTFTLKSEASAIFPIQVAFGDVTFRYATVQPLSFFTNNGMNYHVFISLEGIAPEVVIEGKAKVRVIGATVSTRNGNTVITGTTCNNFEFAINKTRYLVIPFDKAKNSYIVGKSGNQNLVISEGLVLENNVSLELISYGKESSTIEVYPKSNKISSAEAKVLLTKGTDKLFSTWSVSVDKITPDIKLTQTDDRHFLLNAKNLDVSKISDVFLKFDYRGDRGICMMNGELLTDNLYTSEPWTIGLKRYASVLKEKEMYFYFIPMRKDAPYLSYLDKEVVPDFGDKKEFLEIKTPEIIPEYRIRFNLDYCSKSIK